MNLDKIVGGSQAGEWRWQAGTRVFPAIAVCDRNCHGTSGNEVFTGNERFDRRFHGVHGAGHQFDALVMVPNCDKMCRGF